MDFLKITARTRKVRAFSMVEVFVAMGILAMFSAITYAALTQANRYAALTRLRTHALALAQEKIDEVLSASWSLTITPKPSVVTPGTYTDSNLAMNADSTNTQTGLKSQYTDLIKSSTCTRTLVVTQISTRLVRADVTVAYTYGTRNYTVALSTLRTSDTF